MSMFWNLSSWTRSIRLPAPSSVSTPYLPRRSCHRLVQIVMSGMLLDGANNDREWQTFEQFDMQDDKDSVLCILNYRVFKAFVGFRAVVRRVNLSSSLVF